MSAVTAIHALRPANKVNPPLAYTRQAIIDQLCHQATNGPAYVQHSATKALARTSGLYEAGRLIGRQAFDAAVRRAEQLTADVVEQVAEATGKLKTGYARVVELQNGAEVTEEDLGSFARLFKKTNDEEDEEGSNHDEDEPP
ncbi:MAG: hypothetical protein OXS30_05955 [Chloroflexota bacterium]|nr:hypothetical protein [Chloroflexota bacterium]MDE2967013.1 hypothetical protein [Chloroflexota bacterium]